MKKLLYILLSAILAAATACHHRSAASLGDFDISLYAPAYSSGFEIFGAEGMKSTILKTYAPWQGAEGEETQLFIARNGEQAPADFRDRYSTATPGTSSACPRPTSPCSTPWANRSG